MPTKKPRVHECDHREALLDAAETLFARTGLEGTSTRQIAARAKCNVALISYYFKGKEGLYEAVISRHISQVRERIISDDTELEKSWPELRSSDERRLCGLLFGTVEGMHSRPTMQKILMHEMALGARTLIVALAKAERSSGVGRVLDELERGKELGVYRKDLDSRFAALTLMAPLIYSCVGQAILKKAYGFSDLGADFRRQLCLELTKTAFSGWAR